MEQITSLEIDEVKIFIDKFKKEKNIIPLFLVESGSRMWGFASKDSDFDVRGLHLTSLDDELSTKRKIEQYEYLQDLMDVVSYNINKYFALLSTSNPNLLEQLQSSIIYENNWERYGIDFYEFKNKIFELVNFKTLFYHYISMAHKNYEKYIKSGDKFTYKKSLYVLRSLFCSKYIIEKQKVPPVVFVELISQLNIEKQYLDFVDKILEKKSKSEEKTEVFNKDEIINFIDKLFLELENVDIKDTGNRTQLNEYLNIVAIKIKKKAYL